MVKGHMSVRKTVQQDRVCTGVPGEFEYLGHDHPMPARTMT